MEVNKKGLGVMTGQYFFKGFWLVVWLSCISLLVPRLLAAEIFVRRSWWVSIGYVFLLCSLNGKDVGLKLGISRFLWRGLVRGMVIIFGRI